MNCLLMTSQEGRCQESHDKNDVPHDEVIVIQGNDMESVSERNDMSPVSEKRPTPRFQFSGLSQQVRIVTAMMTVMIVM